MQHFKQKHECMIQIYEESRVLREKKLLDLLSEHGGVADRGVEEGTSRAIEVG